jgi:hypothetical protein
MDESSPVIWSSLKRTAEYSLNVFTLCLGRNPENGAAALISTASVTRGVGEMIASLVCCREHCYEIFF